MSEHGKGDEKGFTRRTAIGAGAAGGAGLLLPTAARAAKSRPGGKRRASKSPAAPPSG